MFTLLTQSALLISILHVKSGVFGSRLPILCYDISPIMIVTIVKAKCYSQIPMSAYVNTFKEFVMGTLS